MQKIVLLITVLLYTSSILSMELDRDSSDIAEHIYGDKAFQSPCIVLNNAESLTNNIRHNTASDSSIVLSGQFFWVGVNSMLGLAAVYLAYSAYKKV